MEVASAPWADGQNLIHTIEVGFEETAEFAAWTLIATAMAALAARTIAAAARDVSPS
ncbi:MAG: hypothetical protein H0V45_06080 [Actinobacteria bacterium]|nr:hypothetical protein [Actinomycetota bacterium]